MKRVSDSKRKIWIGCHLHIGSFIYDEEIQGGLSSEKIRIFKLKQWKASTFIKKSFKAGISDKKINVNTEILGQINNYKKMWENARITHCYNCKRHLSEMDFSTCTKCGWIMCGCGACGCGYIQL